MQTNYSPQSEHDPHHIDRDVLIETADEFPLSHYVRALRRYRHVIAFSFLGVLLAYTIVALALYITAPGQKTTAQPFRLDFEGAGEGRYPNGSRFNVADVINGPILARVHKDNNLEPMISYGDFSRSLFVIESNREYDALAARYQAQLADTRLTPVDRERIQREFELKRLSIAKNEYALNFTRPLGMKTLPDLTVKKVLADTLNNWAAFAVDQQHVITYDISVLSPSILTPTADENTNAVVGLEVLRAKANRVLTNIEAMQKLPGATLTRTRDGLSLEELHLRIEQLIRFRAEPLLAATIHSNRNAPDRIATIRFLEAQLAYDQRQLEAAQRKAQAMRDSIAAYEQAVAEQSTERPAASGAQSKLPTGSEALMPQLSDSFIDRLMSLSGRASDVEYRQKRAKDYQVAIEATIGPQQAVAFDTQMLAEMRTGSASAVTMDPAAIRLKIDETRAELGGLIGKVNELLQTISSNMTPSAQLFTLTGPPSTVRVHAINKSRLALYGVLLSLMSLPLIALACLIHDRLREEEAIEGAMHPGAEHRAHVR